MNTKIEYTVASHAQTVKTFNSILWILLNQLAHINS